MADAANPSMPSGSSAAGERRALLGFLPQYRTAAGLVLNALRRRELDFVELTHDANGAVDDLVIGTPARVNAYQVKWREHPTAFTFRQLTVVGGNGRSLIGDLYEGHELLAARFPTKRVVVHLYTCDYPSTNDNCRQDEDTPPLSFAKFLDQVWRPAYAGDPSAIALEPSAWKALREASGAAEEAFARFVPDCRLVFAAQLPGETFDDSRDGTYERDQIRELTQLLMELAVNSQQKHHFDRATLLQRLKWDHFFELRNRHEFSVTSAYEEINVPAKKLNDALDRLPGGYLFVGGSPGSGKSSLLTRTFERRAANERWIRYYAYVPGSPEPGNIRGEAENFLHDVTSALDDAGVVVGHSRSAFDRQQLLIRLDDQLQVLGKQFRQRGIKTILLIDGLDHVPREQRPEVSMLKDLPLPDRLPEGVYVLLGSQTDQLKDIPVSVRTAIAQDERRVLMEPLSPQNVERVIALSNLPVSLSDDQRHSVFTISQGHPLAVGLLINHLRDASTPTAVDAILNSTEPYAGDIDKVYASYWYAIAEDAEVVRLLALLGRLRRHIDIGWLHGFIPLAAMNKLKTPLGHLFNREATSRWFFFHNSFRLFIRYQTATLVAATPEENETTLHGSLADECTKSAAGTPWAWESLYHLAEAGRHDEVLRIATARHFRDQMLALRPLDAIADDIRHAIRSAKEVRDVIALVRLVLAAAEFAQRLDGVSSQEVADVLLRLGEVDVAIEHLFDGRELRVSNVQALQSCRRLKEIERDAEAERLFQLAEPVLPSLKVEGPEASSAHDSLREWVKAASIFRPIDSTTKFIESLIVEPPEFGGITAEEATARLRADLLYELVLQLREDNREDEAAAVEAKLDVEGRRRDWWFWLQVQRWRDSLARGNKKASAKLIRHTLDRLPLESLSNDRRTLVAEGLYRAEGVTPELEAAIAATKQPEAVRDYVSSENALNPFYERFRLNRFLRALGRDVDVSTLVPDSPDPRGEGNVYFERAIIRIAYIWGDAWRGRQYSTADVKQATADLLRMFDRSFEERIRWRSWHSYSYARKEFYSLLIAAVAPHGHEALHALKDLLEREWQHETRRHLWPAAVRRALILDFYDLGFDRDWAIEQLSRLESSMLEGHDIAARVKECKEHAEAWARVRKKEEGLKWLKGMLDTSFGVGYHKDYQLEYWMEWLPRVNAVDPDGAASRFGWFAAASRHLDESTEGRSSRTATNTLVAIAAEWSPRRAAKLLRWFQQHGPIWYASSAARTIEVFVDSKSLSTSVARTALDFLFRFSTESRPTLTEKVVREVSRLHGKDAALAEAIAVHQSLTVFALPSTRYGWVEGLKDGLKAIGIHPLPAMPVPASREDRSSSTTLESSVTLDDGKVVKGDELRQKAATVDGLTELAAKRTDEYFQWTDQFERVAEGASLEDVRRLAAAAVHLSDESIAQSKVSLRLSALGDRKAAWDVGMTALKNSRDYGWTKWGDGGTRVSALKSLVAADPARGHQVAFDMFAGDMMKRRSYPAAVVQNLFEIAPLLTAYIPVKEVWVELQIYLLALSPGMETKPQPDLSLSPEPDNAEQAVADLFAFHLPGPINLLSYGAQHGLGKLLLEQNASAIAVLKHLLRSDEDGRVMSAMGVIEAVAERELASIKCFTDELKRLVDHPNFAIWASARDLLSGTGVEGLSKRPRKSLPAIYSLDLPQYLADPPRLRPVTPGEALPEPMDFVEALSPFDRELRWVARVLNRPPLQLLQRTRQIMSELRQDDDWSAKAEKRLMSQLSDSGLQFTYHRPRGQVARLAMYRAISELFDARIMDATHARFFYEALRPSDPVLMLLPASPRPKEVAPLVGLSDYGHAGQEWVAAVRKDGPRCVRQIGENVVIGEMTTLRRLAWGQPSMEVASGCTTRRLTDDEDIWLVFDRSNLKDYPRFAREADAEHLVVIKQYDGRDSDCAHWLGFNPRIAGSFDWKLVADGLCRWVDASGQMMAETIWWKDSTLDHRPPRFDDEVGEGWLVVMSPTGFQTLRGRFPQIFRTTLNKREFQAEGEQFQEAVQFTEEIDNYAVP